MLKRRDGDRHRLVTQPDHAALSGYLAAHWGTESFRRAGEWDDSPEPEVLRREIVFGIAQHDNGWWEWEAAPEIDPEDGLPLDFLSGSEEAGFERWRRGTARFENTHPLASVLINRHAYWLQAARVAPIREAHFRHPLFGFRPHPSEPASAEAAAVRDFLVERLSHERTLLDRLAIRGAVWQRATRDDTLLPAVRLLQALDTVSLALCGGLRDPLTLLEIPRGSWSDRVSIEVAPAGDGGAVLTPYPFDLDPLPVTVPARLVKPFAWLEAEPKINVELTLRSE